MTGPKLPEPDPATFDPAAEEAIEEGWRIYEEGGPHPLEEWYELCDAEDAAEWDNGRE